MALVPQKLREIVLQSLFSFDMGCQDEERLAKLLMEQYSTARKTTREAVAEAKKVHASIDELDPLIAEVSVSYDFDRIQIVEKNILRLGIYELKIDKKPAKIVLSEAVRLAKKFGSPEAAGFVNALLDAIYKKYFFVVEVDLQKETQET